MMPSKTTTTSSSSGLCQQQTKVTSSSASWPLALAAMADDEGNYTQMQQIFNLIDADEGGTITVDEIETLFSTIGVDVTNEELEELVAEVDHDQNGLVERREFLQLTKRCPRPKHSRAEVLRAFQVCAGRHMPYGVIHYDTLLDAMTRHGRSPLPKDEALVLLKQLDAHRGTGHINYLRYVDAVFAHVFCGHQFDGHEACNHQGCSGNGCIHQKQRRAARLLRRRSVVCYPLSKNPFFACGGAGAAPGGFGAPTTTR